MSALVLIMDADPKRLERLQRVVEQEGAAVLTAAEPREAMMLYVRREPTLTLLQIDRPCEAGLELCDDMKTLGIGRRRSIVVVAPREARTAAFGSGCDAFVVLQSDTRSLRRTVRRILVAAPRLQRAEAITLIA